MISRKEDMDKQKTREIFTELHRLSQLIERHPESFASGSRDISATALKAAKIIFDLSIQSELTSKPHISDLISSLEPSHAPRTRSRVQTKGQRVRSTTPPVKPATTFEITPLSSLFVEGITNDQVWAQLDLKTNNICDILDLALEAGVGEEEEDDVENMTLQDEGLKMAFTELDKPGEDVLDGLEDIPSEDEDEEDLNEHLSLDEMEQDQFGEDLSDVLEEGVMDLRDPSDDDDTDAAESAAHPEKGIIGSRGKKPELHSLNDGFFDLDLFNTETERAEAISTSRGRLSRLEESDDEDMSIDLFAPTQGDIIGEDDPENDPGEALYRDFFEPPALVTKSGPKKTSKKTLTTTPGRVHFHDEVRVKEIRRNGKKVPFSTTSKNVTDGDSFGEDGDMEDLSDMNADISEGDVPDGDFDIDEGEKGRRVMERLKGDLFGEDEDSLREDLSTHEKRLVALQEQITKLESENVGPKDWVLMGEADSRTRPQNSLLEEDLEFERVMKIVPVITEETVQILEERIKVRIIEGRFDDVIRIRPMEDKPFLPSRFFELTDKKSTQSLAQIYENEFTASQGGNNTGEDRDGKLHKEHAEIAQLWEKLCSKLDALCNAHFMPKQAKATISTISNISTATLESALPTTKSATDIFAPEEVFAPVSDVHRARSELTPSEKRALRAKTRKAKKKSRDALDHSVDKYAKMNSVGGVKKQKQAALESVVKSGRGVTVVGKTNKLILRRGGAARPPRM